MLLHRRQIFVYLLVPYIVCLPMKLLSYMWWHQTVQVITCISPHSNAAINHYCLLGIYCNTNSA